MAKIFQMLKKVILLFIINIVYSTADSAVSVLLFNRSVSLSSTINTLKPEIVEKQGSFNLVWAPIFQLHQYFVIFQFPGTDFF